MRKITSLMILALTFYWCLEVSGNLTDPSKTSFFSARHADAADLKDGPGRGCKQKKSFRAIWTEENVRFIRDKYREAITIASEAYGVDEKLIIMLISIESEGKSRAVSCEGALGLMQLMPGTARRLGVKEPFDPLENILGGTKYFKYLMKVYEDKDTALLAYNMGPDKVRKNKRNKAASRKFGYVKKANYVLSKLE